MSATPFISIRKYIKWGDNPAGEDTDTLVLTTASKHFVDIRIYLPSTSSPSTTPSNLPSSRLEWAFAGTASSTPASSTKPAHTIWIHWVDSRTTAEVQDEGDMYPQPNGEVLEYGAMQGPSGDVERYEECWVDLNLVRLEGEDGYRSWTLRTVGEGVEERGVLVRIGQFVSGVRRRGEEVGVGRWVWKGDEGVGWEKFVSIGELEVPGVVFEVGRILKVGERYEGVDGVVWECVEAFDWN